MTRPDPEQPASRNGREAAGRPGGWWVQVPVQGCAEAVGIARHLERFGCRVAAYGDRNLLVEFPSASSKADAEADAELYLSMWRSAHPGFRAARARPHRPPRAA